MQDLILISSRNEQITIGTTSTNVSLSRISTEEKYNCRSYRNTSTGGQVITIVMGNQQAVAKNGIVLNPNETFSDSSGENYECWQGNINAISDLADGKLSVFER